MIRESKARIAPPTSSSHFTFAFAFRLSAQYRFIRSEMALRDGGHPPGSLPHRLKVIDVPLANTWETRAVGKAFIRLTSFEHRQTGDSFYKFLDEGPAEE